MQYQFPLEIWNEIYNYLSLKDKFSLLQSSKLLFDAFGINYMKELLYDKIDPKIASINYECLKHLIGDDSVFGYTLHTSITVQKCIVCKIYTKDISDISYDNRTDERYHYRTIRMDDELDTFEDGEEVYCEKCVDSDRICQRCYSYLTSDPDYDFCDLCIHNCQNEDDDDDEDDTDDDDDDPDEDDEDDDNDT
jgi:hypothetical protein